MNMSTEMDRPTSPPCPANHVHISQLPSTRAALSFLSISGDISAISSFVSNPASVNASFGRVSWLVQEWWYVGCEACGEIVSV